MICYTVSGTRIILLGIVGIDKLIIYIHIKLQITGSKTNRIGLFHDIRKYFGYDDAILESFGTNIIDINIFTGFKHPIIRVVIGGRITGSIKIILYVSQKQNMI